MRVSVSQVLLIIIFATVSNAADLRGQGLLDKKISINIRNENIESILSEIENQTGVVFTYSPSLLINDKITVRAKNQTLGKVLRLVLGDSIAFHVIDNEISLSAASVDPIKSIEPDQPSKQISGTVVDNSDAPIPGVNVLVKGSTKGTSTDADGRFNLIVDEGEVTLVFSFIGFASQEVNVTTQTSIRVIMQPDIKSLEEVVVVGYGTQKRSELTTSVSSVSSQEVKAVPVTSLDQAIKGRAAGVQVTQASGAPGGGVSIRIRGTGSLISGSEPLYVVDGIPVFSDNYQASGRREGAGQPTNALSYLNPGDIESIEILKDAAAASIYGARGSNGVILITTKRGKAGQSNIDFESYYGVQTVRNKIPLLNARQFAELSNEANVNGGVAPAFTAQQIEGLGEGTDWQDEIFRQAPIQNYQLTFSGGDDKTKYAVSGNYFDQEGIIKGSEFSRGSLRVNLDRKINSRMNIGTSLTSTRSKNDVIVTNENGVIRTAYKMSPTLTVRDMNGNYTFNNTATPQTYWEVNPVYIVNEILNEQITSRTLGNVFAEYEILKDLKVRISGGADILTTKENFFESDQYKFRNNRFAWVNSVFTTSWINSNTLTYQKTINEKHALSFLLLYERQSSKNELVQALSEGPQLSTINDLRQGLPLITPRSDASEWGIVSYGGRINYSLSGKYLATLSFRSDGSSKFGKDNKFGFFPAIALGWVLSEEGFMQRISTVNFAKLRASYGVVGNQEIGSYRSLSNVGGGPNYIFNNVKNSGSSPYNVPNPDLKWERTATFDVGIDLTMFNNVEIIADFYSKKTYDLLWNFPLPTTSGFFDVTKNIGSLTNQGFELTINSRNIDRAFKWNTSFNFTTNKNKLVSLTGDEDSVRYGPDNALILIKGQSVGSFYAYRTDGIFQSNDEVSSGPVEGPGTMPGDQRYRDFNGDGTINDSDRTVIGQSAPKFFGGITNTFSYHGIELSIFLQGVYGNEVYNVTQKWDWESLHGKMNNSTEVLNRWTPENPSTTIPRANVNRRNNLPSDRFIQDGSFLRLRDVTVAYNVPRAILDRAKIRSLRIYASGQNLITLTNYYGYDPEVNAVGQNTLNVGIDDTPYPMAKSIVVGLNVGF